MFKRILLAVDNSDGSKPAIGVAAALAASNEAEVSVLHVIEHERGRAAIYDLEMPIEAAHIVEDVVHELRERGVKATGKVANARAGHVGLFVVDEAHDADADTIVVGSRGLSAAQAWAFGSVTHDVIRRFHGCVVVAR